MWTENFHVQLFVLFDALFMHLQKRLTVSQFDMKIY